MNLFADFAHQLHAALTHLYDPRYQPPLLLCQVLSASPAGGAAEIQQQIIQAIALLEPPAPTPMGARSWRLYHLLTYRYIQELTQEETAQKLAITPRHLRREQQQAIQALAQRLWAQYQLTQLTTLPSLPTAGAPDALAAHSTTGAMAADAWRQQLHQELAHLQRHVPGAVTELTQAFAGIAAVGKQLMAQHQVLLRVEPLPTPLLVSIHPSALRQVLLAALEILCGCLTTGEIVLAAYPDGGRGQITIRATPFAQSVHIESELIQEIIRLQGGQVTVSYAAPTLSWQIWLPQVHKVPVLVIDDNDDLVHFYRRYTAQTRYELLPLADEAEVVTAVKRLQPAMILLDVMLPHVDGWELLRYLRADPATQQLPIIVCSVVRRAELALTLGASHYLTKPVGRHELIAALDLVYGQVVEKSGPT